MQSAEKETKLMPKLLTQVCFNEGCIWYETSQEAVVRSKKTNEILGRLRLPTCTSCKGELKDELLKNYED